MKFEDLLSSYENKIEYAHRMMKEENLSFYHHTKEYWEGYLFASNRLFEELKAECGDFQPKLDEITSEDGKRFKKHLNDNDVIILIGVIHYRGESIPVYFDDYGQQLLAVYNGEEISGGSYNSSPEYDFCYMVDQIKDNIKI